ncbi:MAG: ATP-binding protein [Verrucomicrobiota bacterium]
MNKLLLSDLVEDQREFFMGKGCGVAREVDFSRWISHGQVVVISGIRRCGKSTLLRQFAETLDDFHYLNFDDERLFGFGVSDFDDLMQRFQMRSNTRTLLLDEIQNVEGWERFVRRVHDDGYKVVLTGSNAQLLSAELGTRLTGRHVRKELFPFSFCEFLAFKGVDPRCRTMEGKAALSGAFNEYLLSGGFPEFLKCGNPELLQQTYEDILFRDIVSRHGIRDVKGFQNLAHYLFSNFTSGMNYNRLKNILGFSSAASVRKYIGYLEQSYLISEIRRYDFSLKKQHVSSKKVYVVDNAMRSAVSFTFSADRGRLLENLVFMELRRSGHDVYFQQERGECDFIVLRQNEPAWAIQVCAELNPGNQDRELQGLQETLEKMPHAEGLILTENQTDEAALPGERNIPVLPVWRWLTENH